MCFVNCRYKLILVKQGKYIWILILRLGISFRPGIAIETEIRKYCRKLSSNILFEIYYENFFNHYMNIYSG